MGSEPRGNDTPVLITEAEPSYEDQQAVRRRKYAIMMSLRIPCLIIAALCHQIWWLALIILALSIPLPWIAVLIANDRPPLRKENASWFRADRSVGEVESQQHRVIDG